MWQEIIVALIGLSTIAYAGWKAYRFFSGTKQKSNPCSGCTGCALSQMAERKQHLR